jgi:hypothetical protein
VIAVNRRLIGASFPVGPFGAPGEAKFFDILGENEGRQCYGIVFIKE